VTLNIQHRTLNIEHRIEEKEEQTRKPVGRERRALLARRSFNQAWAHLSLEREVSRSQEAVNAQLEDPFN